MDGRRHGATGHLGVAMRDGDGVLLVQAQQHLRALVAEVVDQAVVQSAKAGAGIDGDIGDVERAQRFGDSIAAEPAIASKRGDRALQRGSVPKLGAFLALRPIDHAFSWALTLKAAART